MGDMSAIIVPKSDQLNGEQLLSGPMTVTITGVDIRAAGSEQPVTCHYEGENGRPWKPCKTMSKLLVHVWGPDSKNYIGKSLTLFRDPKVKWAGEEIGGIRVSHMSDIPPAKLDSQGRLVASLMETRGRFKPHVIRPLEIEQKPDAAQKWADDHIAAVQAADDAQFEELVTGGAKAMAKLKNSRPDLHAAVEAAYAAREASDFQEGRTTADMGEGFVDGGEVE